MRIYRSSPPYESEFSTYGLRTPPPAFALADLYARAGGWRPDEDDLDIEPEQVAGVAEAFGRLGVEPPGFLIAASGQGRGDPHRNEPRFRSAGDFKPVEFGEGAAGQFGYADVRRLGRFRGRNHDQQSHRAEALNLVTSCIGLFNCRYLGRAVDDFRQRGVATDDKRLRRLSPLGWDHINLTGDNVWSDSPPSTWTACALSTAKQIPGQCDPAIAFSLVKGVGYLCPDNALRPF